MVYCMGQNFDSIDLKTMKANNKENWRHDLSSPSLIKWSDLKWDLVRRWHKQITSNRTNIQF